MPPIARHPYLHPTRNTPYTIPSQLLDFKVFLVLAWEAMGLPRPTSIQLDMADFLQDPDKTKKAIHAHRGAAKSWLTDAYCSWRLYLNPWLSIVMLSAGGDLATDNSKQVRRLFYLLDFLEPLLHTGNGHTIQVDQWDVGPSPEHSKERSFFAKGITGGITGNRGDLIIWDDVETSVNCLTQLNRDQLRAKVQESNMLFKGGSLQETIILGTPHHTDSLYNGLAKKGFHVRVWPVQYGWDASRYEGEISPMLVALRDANPELAEGGVFGMGQPTHPDLFPESDLLQRAEEGDTAGKSKWLMQMMLDTNGGLKDNHPLRLRDLIVMDCHAEKAPEEVLWGTSLSSGVSSELKDLEAHGLPGDSFYGPRYIAPVMQEYTRKIMMIDPSGKGKDATAYCILAELNGYLYVLKLGGLSGGYDEEKVLTPLAKMAHQYGCQEASYEANWGDGMFGVVAHNVFRKYAPDCSFDREGIKVNNSQKEVRIIDTLEPVLNFHKLIVDRQVVLDDLKVLQEHPAGSAPSYMWQYQMTRLTHDRQCLGHDDSIDVLHLAVAFLQRMLLVSAEDNIASRVEDDEEKEERYIQLLIRSGHGISSANIDDASTWDSGEFSIGGDIDF